MPESGKEHLLHVSHTLQEMYVDVHGLAWVNPADVEDCMILESLSGLLQVVCIRGDDNGDELITID